MRSLLVLTTLVFTLQQVVEALPGSRGFDSGTERLQMTTLEEHEGYKLVSIPKSKWICTAKELDAAEDPLLNWREEYDSPMQAMMSRMKNNPSNEMFQKLFKYIVGVNDKQESIDMTTPVINRMEQHKGSKYKKTMCFWTGTQWEDKDLPTPKSDDIFEMEVQEKEVYVRAFSGYAISLKDWKDHRSKLMESLFANKIKFNKDLYYTVSYDSPWVPGNQRTNEVWMEKRDVDGRNENLVLEKEPAKNADDELEMLPYKIIENNDNYELRQYESQKWVCTMMDKIDPTKDPMNGWEKRYNNNPYAAMAGSEWNDRPGSKMFRKLLKYILGVNKMSLEIEMTRPVIITHLPKESGKEEQHICFWLGSEWQEKTAPEPIEDDVMIKQLKAMKVFVYKFGGFQMSYDDFHEPYMKLVKKLKTDGKQIDESRWIQVSYNSPWTPENRRNEVFVPHI